jgi:hypothetical protein
MRLSMSISPRAHSHADLGVIVVSWSPADIEASERACGIYLSVNEL